MQNLIAQLGRQLSGECYDSNTMRILYATDASVYREMPLAVVLPATIEDIRKIILFAGENKLSIIPRAAGTSLAGQCVGNGIVVDTSKYFNKVIEINAEERWVRLQPGIVRDELNRILKPYGLFFSPNTSTANRCMIGGMVGNNSCGTTSIVYGSTRDHVIELKTILSDGSEVTFGPVDEKTFHQRREQNNLEGKIYQQIFEILSDSENQAQIRKEFPKPSIHRRNTGYAIDVLLDGQPFSKEGEAFNFSKLLCGSEGTLAFTTEIKLHLDILPAPKDVVLCAHFKDINESMLAVQVAMKHQPTACELMDKIILDCTKENLEQQKNRFFVEGDPGAVLMIEFRGLTEEDTLQQASRLINDFKKSGLGYAFPVVSGKDTSKVWALRSAGLGVLANLPGEPKAVACIEDTAVDIEDLPAYIREFSEMMDGFGQKAVYYAHAGAGEIHLRPILDLKKQHDRQLFHDITKSTAELVKKYNGSLSGEHGDGRVRAEFIPIMVGAHNYQLFRTLKEKWDPHYLFNPGKIVDAAPMNEFLRYEEGQVSPKLETLLDFSEVGGILSLAEKCNGSGDCRKLPGSGGTMCPSYMATRNEKDTTRARANILREILTRSKASNPFDSPEIFEVLDLCLSCKGCTSECPSNVDMAALKSEFLYQYYKSNRRPLGNLAFGHFGQLAGLAMIWPQFSNWLLKNPVSGGIMKKILNVAEARQIPSFSKTTVKNWYKREYKNWKPVHPIGKVHFFADEFTNYNDATIGIKAIKLLSKLGYFVVLPKHVNSGRAEISKGLLKSAQKLALKNIELLHDVVREDAPLVGLEPSAILSFRDEYTRLVKTETEKELALNLKENVFTIEEFLEREISKGNIESSSFIDSEKQILLHGHCHQKSLGTVSSSAFILSLPKNFQVQTIPSGCCGMAGSFGYEKNHYEISMQVGELVLFPAVRNSNPETIIAAPGTSCRHQIKDGTKRQAQHPVEILFEALIQ